MKKFLLAVALCCSLYPSADAYYNNYNDTIDYDRGYNIGYRDGYHHRYNPPYGSSDEYYRGYRDGSGDGTTDYNNDYAMAQNMRNMY